MALPLNHAAEFNRIVAKQLGGRSHRAASGQLRGRLGESSHMATANRGRRRGGIADTVYTATGSFFAQLKRR
jgi:hypothetical protein